MPTRRLVQVNFVQTVRAMESVLGIDYDTDMASTLESDLGLGDVDPASDVIENLFGVPVVKKRVKQSASAVTSPSNAGLARRTATPTSAPTPTPTAPKTKRKPAECKSKRKAANDSESKAARDALQDAFPILSRLAYTLGMPELANIGSGDVRGAGQALTTNFMDVSWQYNDPPNPAQAALGLQTYDNHLYYLCVGGSLFVFI